MGLTYTFGARLAFFDKNASEAYERYGEARLLAKKDNVVRKALRRTLLRWVAGRAGV